MNRVFCIGKLLEDVRYGFLLNVKMYSAATTLLEIPEYYSSSNYTIIKIIGFNNIADRMYRRLEKNNFIILEGQISTKGYIEIINFKILKCNTF